MPMAWTWMSQLVAGAGTPTYLLSLADVFLLFFIMIGPIKSIGPFASATASLTPAQLRSTAWKVFAISLVTVVLAGVLGGNILQKWRIQPEVLQFAGGLVFLLVALQMVLSQYRPPAAAGAAPSAPSIAHLVFPVTLPAYGIAALIVLVAMSASLDRMLMILALAALVLALDLLMMLFVRPLLRMIGLLPLQVLGAVLGMLQVALALQLIVGAVRLARAHGLLG